MLKNKNNDLKIKTVLIAFAFCFVLTLSFFLHAYSPVNADQPASNAAAGSADDPLITLSYLNKIYTPMLSKAIDSAINTNNANNITESTRPVEQTTAYLPNTSSTYEVLELRKGQSVRAKSDSLELILRQGGTASVVSPHKEQGLVDLTAGVELLNGNILSVNHSLLVPRADGRGLTVISAVAYVMVRGDYEIY